MFHTNKFLMMTDVKIILSCLLKDFESDDSLEGLIYAIRDLINLIDSHECLQRSIAELSKMKIQDQKHFENIALAVIKDVHQATSDLRKKIDCFPRLKEAINSTFFADIKNKVKLSEYPNIMEALSKAQPIVSVSAEAASQAVAWCSYLETHAKRLYSSAKDPAMEAARALLDRIKKGDLQNGFAARDAYRKQWSYLNSSDLVHQGTKILVDFGWIKEEQIDQKGKLIRIHPSIRRT
jgi:hypothetical protein